MAASSFLTPDNLTHFENKQMRIALCALIMLLCSGILWLANLPRDIGLDVPEGKLNSLSFAPFREGHNPIAGKFPTEAEVDEDMRLMADITHGIRTYASAEGTMPLVPGMARKYGLQMIQGAWLGYLKKDNEKEVVELIRSANANPDVVKRVIVGNEVLLRGEMPPEELLGHIRRVKAEVSQPVSYADVWSMYMKHPELIREVDYITIHILPYWEDEPIPAEQASAHIENIYRLVRQEADAIAPGKPILIGEAGWPGAGRQRASAVPSVVNQALVVRGLIHTAAANGFDVNIVEALNQPWKSILEGVVGSNWGLYSSKREKVFALTGPVREDPHWHWKLLSALGLFALGSALAWGRLKTLAVGKSAVYLCILMTVCALWVFDGAFLWYTSYSDAQRGWAVAVMLFNLGFAGLLMQRIGQVFAGRHCGELCVALISTLYGLLVGFVLYKNYNLALHGRYISFPLAETSVAVFALAALVMVHSAGQRGLRIPGLYGLLGREGKAGPGLRLAGYALPLSVLGLFWGEGRAFVLSRDFILAHPDVTDRVRIAAGYVFGNTQLVTWAVFALIIALPALARGRGRGSF